MKARTVNIDEMQPNITIATDMQEHMYTERAFLLNR